MRYRSQTCIRSACTGTGALARVNSTGTSDSEKIIEARLNNSKSEGSPAVNRKLPQPAAK
jgi:hypothetical protein